MSMYNDTIQGLGKTFGCVSAIVHVSVLFQFFCLVLPMSALICHLICPVLTLAKVQPADGGIGLCTAL